MLCIMLIGFLIFCIPHLYKWGQTNELAAECIFVMKNVLLSDKQATLIYVCLSQLCSLWKVLILNYPHLGLILYRRSAHTQLINHFLIKVANCMDRLYLLKSSGAYISKGEQCCSWGNYKQAFPPEDLPASYASVSSFLKGYCWNNARLYSLIYLIMAMNKVCLHASGG